MTTFYLPDRTCTHMAHRYPQVKMEGYSGEPTRSTGPGIPIATIVTANENWRGKNDPAERRRIQNRLNQRAFRERQRSGASPKQYKPRSSSGQSQDQDDSDDESDSPQSEDSQPSTGNYIEGNPASAPAPACERPNTVTDTQTGRVWDELAQLINRNFMSAAVTNAQHLSIDLTALQVGTPIRTPRTEERQLPASLTPVALQYQVPHDPIIDTIPHARLRYNILRAIAARQIDATDFSKSVRASGALEQVGGSWQRGGVVVWSFPEQVASWELSEPFVRRWAFLLQGCEDLIAATNSWRSRRGERTFPISLTRSDGMAQR